VHLGLIIFKDKQDFLQQIEELLPISFAYTRKLNAELLEMNLYRLVGDSLAARSESHDNAAPIAGAVVPLNPSFFLDLVDPIGDRART
jgi:hypothetical protein